MRIVALILLAAGANGQIRIAVNATTIESAPVFLAGKIPGVEVVPVPNGRVAMEQLLHGSVDAATGSETQMLLNSVAEPGIRIILTLAEAQYRIIARRSSGIRGIKDLRGKRVAATVNTSSLYFLREMLLSSGLLLDTDVGFVNLEGPDMPTALKRGDVDAIAMWEPHAQNSLDALGEDAVVLQNASAYRERFNLNTTTKALNDPNKRHALVEAVRAALHASDRIRSRPSEARTMLASYINASPATVERVWNQFRFPGNIPGDLAPALGKVELFVAGVQNRQPRPRAALVPLIDSSVLAEARR